MQEFTTLINGRYTSGSKKHDESFTEVLRDANGMVTNNVGLKAQEELDATAKLILDGEAVIEAHIQAPIDAYNEASGTKFDNAHNCSNYKNDVGYTHQQFCIDIWDFNVAVWEQGRAIQVQAVTEGWDEVTFIASLPVFGE